MAGLVGLALTSCEDKSDLGVMQKNEAPIVVPADGVALQSLYGAEGNKINLQNYEESALVPLVDIELASTFPESSTVSGLVEISDNADFTNAQTITLTSEPAANQNAVLAEAVSGETRSLQGMVEMTAWNNAFVSFYGLNPEANVNYLRYKLWLTNGDQKVILYNNNGEEWFDAMAFTVTPLDAKLDVNSTYYLNYVVEGKEQTTVQMYHNPDKHVYDDPNFNAMVEVGEDETVLWWITTDEIGQNPYGVEASDPTAASGNLGKVDGTTYVSGQISVAGAYQVAVNMLELTYTVKMAPNSLYVWYTSSNPKITSFDDVSQLGTTDYEEYTGMAGLYSNWCLTGQPNYKPILYVNDANVAPETDGNNASGAISFSSDGVQAYAENPIAKGSNNGLFYITANLTSLKYTTYYCKTMGIVGSLTNWGNETDGVVTPDIALKTTRSSQSLVWTGEVTLTAGDEWKIRANSEWVVDFGTSGDGSYATDGSTIELTKGAGNFKAAESGTYNVTINFKRQYVDGAMTPYTMTITPKE